MLYNFDDLTQQERIIEFLVANQSKIKGEVDELRKLKLMCIQRENPIFKFDLEEQFEGRIRQYIAFLVSDSLGLPIENVIIEIELMKLDEYLDV